MADDAPLMGDSYQSPQNVSAPPVEEPKESATDLQDDYKEDFRPRPRIPARVKKTGHYNIMAISFLLVVVLFTFLVSGITYGTSCPSKLTPPISVKIGNETWDVDELQCSNPLRWLNPSASNKESRFLGIILLPPQIYMIYAIVLSVFAIYVLAYHGIYGNMQKDIDHALSLLKWLGYGIWVAAISLVLAIFGWVTVMSRDAPDNRLCTQLASHFFPMCNAVFGQIVYFAIILTLLAVLRSQTQLAKRAGVYRRQ